MEQKLLVIYDTLFNGFKPEFLDILGVTALLLGITVITIKNPIGSLMCLIGLFGAISVYLIMIGLNFIGFSYLIVYIGAVSILFLFILMLINIRSSELLSNNINSIPLGLLIIILLDTVWIYISPDYSSILENTEVINTFYTTLLSDLQIFNSSELTDIMFAISNNWDGYLVETSHITSVGMVIYSVYNTWLWIASLILILAMVGSITITSKQLKKEYISMVEGLFYTQKVKGSNPFIPISYHIL